MRRLNLSFRLAASPRCCGSEAGYAPESVANDADLPAGSRPVEDGESCMSKAAVIVAHNHPSGDPTRSPEDVSVTHHTVEAGKLADDELLDHLCVGGNRRISLRDRG